ncbi:MAG: hypothetical protein NTW21_30605 [Verrucomicrobia bacterium]|nr:hypothetical protein [Verrucomicrobiota bacterium]
MNRLRYFTLAALLLAPLASLHAIDVANLRCEYLNNPLGIDVAKPCLSWVLEERIQGTGARGQRQAAYQVLVASTPGLLAKDQGDLWDSGKVASDQSIQVEYAGKPLESRMQCHWKVRVWTLTSDLRPLTSSSWSKPALWSMGLLKPGDWQAKWIEQQKPGVFAAVKSVNWIWFPEGDPAVSAPAEARYFRRVVTLPDGRKIARAVCQITVDNSLEVFINGNKAVEGKDWATPAELDVTGLMKSGTNSIAVMAVNSGGPGPAGLLGLLRVEFTQGEPLVIPTDGQWKAAKERKDGWEREGFDDSSWAGAKVLGPYGMVPWDTGGSEPWVPRYLRREFGVTKPVVRSTAYVFGQCYFDLFMNGQKVSDDVMNPALSDHTKALL